MYMFFFLVNAKYNFIVCKKYNSDFSQLNGVAKIMYKCLKLILI